MSEFKIKVSVDLDTSDIEGKLKDLGKEQEIPIKIDSSEINKIESQIKGLKASFQDAFKFDKSFINDVDKLVDALKKLKNLPGGNSPNSPFKPSSLVNDYKELANIAGKLQKQLNKGGLGNDSIDRTKNKIADLKAEMSSLYNKMDSNAQKQIDLFNTKQMNKGIVDMNSAISKIDTQATSLLTRLKNISFDGIENIDTSKISSRIKEAETQLKGLQDIAKQDIDVKLNVGEKITELNKLSNEIKNLEKIDDVFSKIKNSADSVDFSRMTNEIQDLVNSADKMDGSFEKTLKGVNSGIKEVQSSIKKISSDTKGKGLFGSILGTKKDFLDNFASFTLAEVAGDFISDGIRTIARGWKDTVVETDAAMTDLRKVYDKNLTGDALKGYLNDVTQVAKGTGKSSVDVIQGTAKAVQSGIKDIDDALVFARQSAMFSNVGDVSQEQADTMLTSIMSAYGGVENSLKPVREQVQGMGKDYNTLTKFMDLANHSGNRYAVTTSDIGTALQQSAAALKTNGVTMEESVAMA